MDEPSRKSKHSAALDGLALVAIVGFGLWINASRLDSWSLWNDELSSVWRSGGPLRDVLARSKSDVHPPGYYFLLHAVMGVFGNSEIAVRTPSVIAWAIAALGTFVVGRQLFSSGAGLCAAAALQVSGATYLAREARGYAFMMAGFVWTVAAVIYWLRTFDGATKRRAIVSQVVVAVLAALTLYTHYLALLYLGLLLGTAAAFAFRRAKRDGLIQWASICGGAGLLYAPWLGETYRDAAHGKSWMGTPKYSAFFDFLSFAAPSAILVIAAAVVVGATAYALSARSQRPLASALPVRELLLLAWFVLPPLLLILKSRFSTSAFTTRNLIASVPAAALLAGQGFALVLRTQNAQRLFPVALSGCALLAPSIFPRGPGHNEQFREAAAFAIARTPDNREAKALVFASAWKGDYFDHYFARAGSRMRVSGTVNTPEQVEAARKLLSKKKACQVWLVWGHVKPSPQLQKGLQQLGYQQSADTKLKQAGARLFQRPDCK